MVKNEVKEKGDALFFVCVGFGWKIDYLKKNWKFMLFVVLSEKKSFGLYIEAKKKATSLLYAQTTSISHGFQN